MIKNAVISLLAAVLLSGAECYADYRVVMILCIWVPAMLVVCHIEDLYERMHARKVRE